MAAYYFGGYYLIKPNPMKFWSQNPSIVYSASNWLNPSLLDTWSYSWTTANDADIDRIKQEYSIDDETVQSIRQWVDKAFEDKRIGWFSIFNRLETVKEYQQKFFAHLPGIKIIGIYFSETDVDTILTILMPRQEKGFGTEGLYDCLKEKIPETDSVKEIFIGFDIVGIEVGVNFHTFCSNLAPEDLADWFGLSINDYGLFENSNNWESVLAYMNDKESPVEPVPWFIGKTKLVTEWHQ